MLEVDSLRSVVDSTFQSSQSNTESHKALCLNLKAAHNEAIRNGNSAQFFNFFVRCLDRLLSTSRKDQCAARVAEFVVSYAKLICPEDTDENAEVQDEFELFVQFVEAIVERYIPGFDSRLANVRYRCVSLIGTLVPLAPLNEDLLATLEEQAILRLKDSDSRVRVQAVILVSRFDLNEATSRALSIAMQHDPSAEVRLVATYNIAHGSKMLTELACERVRDSGTQIRKGLYSKVLRTIDFRALSIKARENIVRAGLNDRDEGVKHAASMLIASRWLNMSDNNIELVLQRLDVIGHTDIGDLVLDAFFELRRDVVEQLDFGEQFWAELWIEDTVLLRGFQKFCLREKLDELLYERLPDLTFLATQIESLWNKFISPQTYEACTSIEEAEDLRECLPFMVEQLLEVASRYDLDDEASRQKITAVISNIIMAEDAPSNQTIEHIVAIQRRLNASDTALVSWAFETLEAMPSFATQEATISDELLIINLLRALSLFNAVLARVSSHDVAAYLPTLYSTYIAPSMESPVADIRAPALKCLGLASLLDSKFAAEHISQFAEVITKNGHEVLKSSAETAAAIIAAEEETVISIDAMTDLILVHVGADLPIAAIANLWVSLLQSTRPAVQGSAALSLAKLILANQIEDSSVILPRLVVFYFENTSGIEDDEARALTQQQLTLFLRALCMYQEGKEALADVFTVVFEQFTVYKSTQTTSITIGDLLSQFLELTSSEKPGHSITNFQGEPDDPRSWHHAHAHIAFELIKILSTIDDVSRKRSIVSSLAKVQLRGASLVALEQLDGVLSQLGDFSDIRTVATRNALLAFQSDIAKLIEVAKKGDSHAVTGQAVSNQAVSNQAVSNQDVSNQDVSNQAVANQEGVNQEVVNQGVVNQEVVEEAMVDEASNEAPTDLALNKPSIVDLAHGVNRESDREADPSDDMVDI